MADIINIKGLPQIPSIFDKKNVNITMLMGNGAQPYFKVNPQ